VPQSARAGTFFAWDERRPHGALSHIKRDERTALFCPLRLRFSGLDAFRVDGMDHSALNWSSMLTLCLQAGKEVIRRINVNH